MSLVVPAVLPSSLQDLKEKIALLGSISSVDRIQIDVVDGRFATPASWPYVAPRTKSDLVRDRPADELDDMVERSEMLPRLDRIEYEIDLMCLDMAAAAAKWLALGAVRLTFHAEAATDLPRLLASARKQFGAGADFAPGLISFGLALNIGSDLALIEACVGEIDYVQFMGISTIGRQGQPFDRRVFEKLRVFHGRHPDIPVQVDGGVSLTYAKQLVACGASKLVVGSNILKAADPAAVIAAFEDLQGSFGV